MNRRSPLAVLAALALLAACDKDSDVEVPAELIDIQQTVAVKKVWSSSVGDAKPKLRLGLSLAYDDGVLFAAARNGNVEALDAASGKQRWRVDTKLDLSAGPGVGGGKVVVGTNDGDVLALNAGSGDKLWRVKVRGEVLAPPLVTADYVVVRTVDGWLLALDGNDGSERWSVEELVPRLTLRGNSSPILSGDTVVCGFDNGRVVAVSLSGGDILWQTQVSIPRGRTELERLSDIDANLRIADGDIYAVGYHGRVAMLALDTGQVWWGRDLSSYSGLDLDQERVFVTGSDGSVVALRRRDGGVVWQQDALLYRRLSAPAVTGQYIVVGDLDGYLHWLDRDSGEFVARDRMSRDRLASQPLVVDGMLYAMNVEGKIVAYRSEGAAGG
jgi:outer membrane protein assembly factor BamB